METWLTYIWHSPSEDLIYYVNMTDLHMALSLRGSNSATITNAGGRLAKLAVSFLMGDPRKLCLSSSFSK